MIQQMEAVWINYSLFCPLELWVMIFALQADVNCVVFCILDQHEIIIYTFLYKYIYNSILNDVEYSVPFATCLLWLAFDLAWNRCLLKGLEAWASILIASRVVGLMQLLRTQWLISQILTLCSWCLQTVISIFIHLHVLSLNFILCNAMDWKDLHYVRWTFSTMNNLLGCFRLCNWYYIIAFPTQLCWRYHSLPLR